MNVLIVGSNKSDLIEYLPDTFLIVYDGELTVPLPERRKVTRLDLSQHAFNPLKNINYKRARDFLAVLNSVFPEGENTLTKKSANFVLLKALLSHPTRLDKLLTKPDKNDPGALDAYQKIQTLLLSPTLRPFLCKPTNFSLQGIVLASLDPAIITEFDAFVIGKPSHLKLRAHRSHPRLRNVRVQVSPFPSSTGKIGCGCKSSRRGALAHRKPAPLSQNHP